MKTYLKPFDKARNASWTDEQNENVDRRWKVGDAVEIVLPAKHYGTKGIIKSGCVIISVEPFDREGVVKCSRAHLRPLRNITPDIEYVQSELQEFDETKDYHDDDDDVDVDNLVDVNQWISTVMEALSQKKRDKLAYKELMIISNRAACLLVAVN